MNPAKSAESEAEGETLQWMRSVAAQYGVTIAGGVAVKVGEEYFNRLYVVRSDGSYAKYDKRHLFSFSGEHEVYKAGDERVVVEIDGVKVLLLICYDLRFPVWCRNRGDYDLIVCVANWAASRRFVWDTLLRSRAIENVSYMCGVNIVGEDLSCSYSGGTAAINYLGQTVAVVADGEQGVATFEVDIEALRAFRRKFPVLGDADRFEIE